MAPHLEVQVSQDGEVLVTRTVSERPMLIGKAPNNDLVLDGTARHRALLWNEDGTLWIKNLDEENPLVIDGAEVGQASAVPADKQVQLADSIALIVKAAEAVAPSVHPYRLTVDLQATTGPEATLEDLETGRVCTIRSNNRVSVLYLLAKQLIDQGGDAEAKERGWCQDQEIACGVWGRNWQKQIKSHLHVLVHRIRKDIKSAGLDPWCIEKKRCHTRATVLEAVIK